MPVDKARIQSWSADAHHATLSAKFNSHEPPGIDELLRAVLSTWAKDNTYIIDAGRLARVDIHKDPVTPR